VKRALLLAVATALLLAGCGDDSTSQTTTTAAGTSTVRVYFLSDGKVWPVARPVGSTDELEDVVTQAMQYLVLGPEREGKELGFAGAMSVDLDSAVAHPSNGMVSIKTKNGLSQEGLAQLVYTLTQFPSIKAVEIDGERYTRADFEEQTPLILVESPLPFADVTTPLRVTGTANTFEATFQYELVDADGNVIDKNFVTATSGTGTRGTFDFTTREVDDVAALRVFELSAKDGSRINEVEIPLSTGS
jgi:hypothetical protein